MPELPEVETMCRGIRSIVGHTIATVTTPPCRYRPISIKPKVASIRRRLLNRKVTDVTRLGKRVVIHVGDLALILHPRMSGMVSMETPPDTDHVRLQIQLTGTPKKHVLFWDRRGLGTVELMSAADIQARQVDGRLGPDALAVSCDDFCDRLATTRRPIKVALLDQRLLAGIGNLYASEMLHAARIHPAKQCCSTSRKRKRLLHEVMRSILLAAIESEGSTLSDGTYRNVLNEPGGYQNYHLVYDRAGQRCPSCSSGTIRRIVQAQRSTFYCPKCQRG